MTQYQEERFPIPTPARLRRELRLGRPPWWMVLTLLLLLVGAVIPLYWIYQARTTYSTLPKIHFIQDMDNQPRFGPQQPSNLFADGRATRLPVAGTLARGHSRLDDHYYRGYRENKTGTTASIEFFASIPESITVDAALIERGRERYSIYCALCHDDHGTGNGIIHQRAVSLNEAKWVPPTNLLTQQIRDRPDGQIYQAIVDGVRNMPSYKTQIDVEDRWAIVAYVRQLQSTQGVAIVDQPNSTE